MLGFDLPSTAKYRRFQQEFVDLGKIGSGGFSNVHHVRSKLDHREYALKIIEIKPRDHKEEVVETLYKCLEEVKIMSFLNHKNVIQYYGSWIESELNEGVTLTANSSDKGRVSEKESRQSNEVLKKSAKGIDFDSEEEEEEFIMVVDDFGMGMESSSGGIEFYNSSDNSSSAQSQAQHPQLQKEISNVSNVPSLKKVMSIEDQIKHRYAYIRIFILCELCQTNLQTFIARRNSQLRHSSRPKIDGKENSPKARNLAFPTSSDDSIHNKGLMIENYKMILQIIQGLEYLHSKRIIHRDIKLHNIILDEKTKQCKIIDYGLSKKTRMLQSFNESDLERHAFKKNSEGEYEPETDSETEEVFSSSVGTRIFSSPEQLHSERYDHRTDIFSLGIVIVLFFCHFTTMHQELDTIERIRKADLDVGFQDIDPRLKNVLKKCLGEEKSRPRLNQVRSVVKELLREEYYESCLLKQKEDRRGSQKGSTTSEGGEKIMEKEQEVYVVCGKNRLVKKMSKENYLSKSFGEGNEFSNNRVVSFSIQA